MDNNLEKIYFERKNKIIISEIKIGEKEVEENNQYIATILKNLENYGYTLDKELIKLLKYLDKEIIIDLYKKIISYIKIEENMTPMYPNFPKQVMEMDEIELYINAIIHYLTLGKYIPQTKKEERFPLIEKTDLTPISLGSEKDFLKIFVNLLSSKTPLSSYDKKDIKEILSKYENIENIIPDEIPMKETLLFVINELFDLDKTNNLNKLCKTTTDVLRLAVAMSDGDISLSQNTKFRNFTRKERRMLLSMIENCSNKEENMLKYSEQWKRLGEKLHPSDFKNKYEKTNRAFEIIRNGEKIKTFNSQIETAIKDKDLDKILYLLDKRPGEFARRLNQILTLFPSIKVIFSFGAVADKVPTPILLNIKESFKHRNDNKIRVFFPKGNVSKAYGLEEDRKPLEENLCNLITDVIDNVLIQRFKEKETLGKVFIDGELKQYAVPLNLRNNSKGKRLIARGSKLKIKEEGNFIRAYVHWLNINNTNEEERVDLDLSAAFYKEDFSKMETVAFYNLRASKLGSYHSGDLTDAPKESGGATEYIDINIKKALSEGYRYVAIMVNSYTRQKFSEIESFMGYMVREDGANGEIFEPKTVANQIDLDSPSIQILPMVIDLKEKVVIWADMTVKSLPYCRNNVENNKNALLWTLKSIIYTNKTNMYDLLQLHAKARGTEIVDKKEDADTIFGLNRKEGLTPYDIDVIISEYL